MWTRPTMLEHEAPSGTPHDHADGVAHDLNNLLTLLMGNAQLLRDTVDAEDRASRDLLKVMTSAILRCQRLVEQLGAASQESGEEGCSPASVIVQQESSYRRQLSNTITLEVDVEEARGVHVRLAAAVLDQVLTNLVANAGDAMPAGGVLTIRARSKDSGETVAIEVKDTGYGMTASQRERMFLPFYSTKGEKGAGTGLAETRSAIKAAGGRIEVESRLGHGTTVRAVLPGFSG